MQFQTVHADAAPDTPKLSLSLASTPEEVREVQRLRYKIFIENNGLSALANEEELDADEFDEHCDHLIVRDSSTLNAVGTYRVLGPSRMLKLGRCYSDSEFDLSRLAYLRGRMVEAGRACIHPDYRSGGVIMMLWAGLADYMRRNGCDYLAGCASISLKDGEENAASLYHSLARTHLSPAEYRVTPHLAFPTGEPEPRRQHQVPPLVKGYLRSGAWICGEPAWDQEFHCVDMFMLLPLANLDGRYARRYLAEKS
jgi:putative hemolysin